MAFKIKGQITSTRKPKEEEVIKPEHLEDIEEGVIKDRKTVVIRLARCYNSTNGDFGLIGYIQGKNYHCRRMGKDKKGRPYYKIWKDYYDFPQQYDTMIAFEFQYYFKVLGIDEMRGSPPPRSQRR